MGDEEVSGGSESGGSEEWDCVVGVGVVRVSDISCVQ